MALPGRAPAGGRGRGQVQLPDGAGKEAVDATCGGCHGLNMITGAAGYTQDGWRDLIATMVALPEAQAATITQYLATHFPPKPGRAPVLVAGDVSVTFREWMVPTLGQRSRDPLQTADGTIWWNGQFISLVGRLNPRTGEMKEYKLDADAASAQHRRRRGRQHLVHGQRQRHDRQARAGDRRDHRLTRCPIRPRAIRTPAIFDKNGHAVLHAAAEQHDRTPDAVDRRDQAGHAADAARAALRHQAELARARSGSRTTAPASSRAWIPVTMEVREYPLPDPAIAIAPAGDHQRRQMWFVNSSLGPPRPAEPEDRRGQGMAVAERRRSRTRTRSR